MPNNGTLTGFDNLPAVFSSMIVLLCNENITLRDSVDEKNIIIGKLNHEANVTLIFQNVILQGITLI